MAAALGAAAAAFSAPTPTVVCRSMLANLRQNGFDADPRVNGGLGGLWVNWRTGTRPLETNFDGSGVPDAASRQSAPRHDPLTDLRYLHNLFSWKHLHPADPTLDGEIARYDRIVQREFARTRDERGWMYDEFIDMARLSGDPFYRETARGLAESYAKQASQSDVGIPYKASAADPTGHYRTDLVLEAGCALVMAGKQFGRPEWTAEGERVVDFVYAHAYLPRYHLFLVQMAGVREPGGGANPDERIYRTWLRNYEADGGVVRFGNIGLVALSLLHTYIVTGQAQFLARANDLLEPLTATDNRLGLWDPRYGGYFNGVEFPGPDYLHPGSPRRLTEKKEAGRQFHMLQAFHVADRLTGGRYRAMEQALLGILLDKAYNPKIQGIVYEVAPDWSFLRVRKGGPVEDWVTSEAMGCAMLALFSLQEPSPW